MKRTVWLIAGSVALVALLAGGAFVGGRLLAQRSQAGSGNGLGLPMLGGPSGPKRVRLTNLPAPELPQAPADARGIFVRREDKSVFIGTGQASLMVKGSPGQTPQTATNYSGPVVEVVISQDTTVYRDTTQIPEGASGDVQVQQTVAPGSIDEIGQNSMISVWGRKSGDRVVAQVVVYMEPAILNARPPSQ